MYAAEDEFIRDLRFMPRLANSAGSENKRAFSAGKAHSGNVQGCPFGLP